MKLQEEQPVARQTPGRRRNQTPGGAEAVVGREDRVCGFREQLRMVSGGLSRDVREVRDDQVEAARYRLEKVAVPDENPALEAVAADVRPGDEAGGEAGVGRPDLDLRAPARRRDGGYATVSLFFSEVFGTTIKVSGDTTQFDELHEDGGTLEDGFLALYGDRGRAVGAISVRQGDEREALLKDLVAEGAPVDALERELVGSQR